jgi:glycosyltransferase involved in cell wall biosynthesis
MVRILIVGTVSNVASNFSSDYSRLLKAFSGYSSVETFVVESDSTDSTLDVLNKYSTKSDSFEFKSLGRLRDKFPERISRIRECRNVYVRYIRENHAESNWDFIVVADLDGVNHKLDSRGIQSSLNLDLNWDQISANQSFGYYDLLALRHPYWMPNDCLAELNWAKNTFLMDSNWPFKSLKLRMKNDKLRKSYIYEKMYRIKKTSHPIEVDSAFGGLAIYKTHIFLEFDYSLDLALTSSESEHVTLHRKMREKGYRLFINPGMVNSGVNDHNINRVFIVRQTRDLAKRFTILRRIGQIFLGILLR